LFISCRCQPTCLCIRGFNTPTCAKPPCSPAAALPDKITATGGAQQITVNDRPGPTQFSEWLSRHKPGRPAIASIRSALPASRSIRRRQREMPMSSQRSIARPHSSSHRPGAPIPACGVCSSEFGEPRRSSSTPPPTRAEHGVRLPSWSHKGSASTEAAALIGLMQLR